MSDPLILSLNRAVTSGKIDGFQLPYEAFCLFGQVFADAACYEVPGGRLFLKDQAWRKFGYLNGKDFAEDARKGNVYCKSAAGALSLGRAAERRKGGPAVYLLRPTFRIKIPCDHQEEAAAVSSLLNELALQIGPVVAAARGPALLTMPHPLNSFRHPVLAYRSLSRGLQYHLGALALLAVAATGLLIASGRITWPVVGLFGCLFFILWSVSPQRE